MSISRRCFLSSRSEASRHIPSTIMVAPAKINSQTYRVSIAVSSCANFVVGDSKIFSTLFREELNLLSLASSDALRREQWICHPDKHCQPVDRFSKAARTFELAKTFLTTAKILGLFQNQSSGPLRDFDS